MDYKAARPDRPRRKVQGGSRCREADALTSEPRPIRRVVTGNDEHGRSGVLFDSAAPNVNPGAISRGTCMTDIWVYQTAPAVISGARDDGNLPFHFEPPAAGGHLAYRAVERQTRRLRRGEGSGVTNRSGRRGCVPTASGTAAGRIGSQLAGAQIRDRRLRHSAQRRTHAAARSRQCHHESRRCGGAARQLARLDQCQRTKPDGLRHDGRDLRARTESRAESSDHEQ